ncbi:MAG: hypothetical protein NTU62_00415 [Spirochaetes bacterium]|nr:hypothetical protein [Spirochaetota bacterium]
MRQDVIDSLSGVFPSRIPTKETLNHPGLIRRVSGLDPWDHPADAFGEAWRKLSIDVHAAAPASATRPQVPGGTWVENGWRCADIGVFPTAVRVSYLEDLDHSGDDWIYAYDPKRDDIDPVAQAAALAAAQAEFRARFGDLAVHDHLYYTMLFTWPVVTFDWEPFLAAAVLDPERFDRHFWQPWAEISRRNVEGLAAMGEEVVFVHDDLATSRGPVFSPAFYDRWIFPRYERILEPAVRAGRRIVFASDGNIDAFLERLLELPFAGLVYENPATSFDRVLATWGEAGRGFIGGIDTALLTHASPGEVAAHTRSVIERGSRYPGFVLSSCGGLYGDVPMENLLAYFETRDRMGIPAEV